MSLINDALKRAQESQRPDKPSGASSLRTIETRPAERPFISRLLVIVIFLLLAGAIAFIGLALTGRMAKKNIVAPKAVRTHPPQSSHAPEVVNAAPVVVVQPAPVPVVTLAVTTAVTTAPVVLTPLVLPDTLHVQGIAYDPVRPWAIVSGRTVYVGDLVKGVRVMAISPNSVTFGSHGQTNLLFVGE